MNVDEIIKAIADQNAILETWKENRVEMSNRLRQLEQDISYGEKRRSELLAQLKAILAEDNSKSTERIIEPQTDDTLQTVDSTYSIVRRRIRIVGVRWAKDVERVMEVTVSDDETHKPVKLFTSIEPYIKTCIYSLGKIANVEYEENSGELLNVSVGE
jgi:hypothetical protein